MWNGMAVCPSLNSLLHKRKDWKYGTGPRLSECEFHRRGPIRCDVVWRRCVVSSLWSWTQKKRTQLVCSRSLLDHQKCQVVDPCCEWIGLFLFAVWVFLYSVVRHLHLSGSISLVQKATFSNNSSRRKTIDQTIHVCRMGMDVFVLYFVWLGLWGCWPMS